MSDALSLLVLPFAASIAFVLIHAYFGVHVLRRNIVFADLALAQLSALGATVAFANGYSPASAAGFAYGLLFTAIGAALLTLSRSLARWVSQEALVGILYVVATAATILVVDRSPQGAEHVKKILLGSILTVGPAELAKFAALYTAIGTLCWFARRPLLAVSGETRPAGQSALAVSIWDFFFFLTFGVVVTSSVTTAGVLLVFSFLIVPAVIGFIFTRSMHVVLAIAWGIGIAASAAGLAGSYMLDLPTGAAMVTAFALFLVLAGIAKALVLADPGRRWINLRHAVRAVLALALTLTFASSLWLIINPAADQPLAATFESATGLGPQHFLSASERDIYENAGRDSVRFQNEVDRLNEKERAARYQGAPLSDDEIRRIASYQQSFNEMTRGERFVQDVLRTKARALERWFVGLPAMLISLMGFGLLLRPFWRHRSSGGIIDERPPTKNSVVMTSE
ncbi:MAG TPA: metal ABC transporter permease [Candidatus Binatia bacterium]